MIVVLVIARDRLSYLKKTVASLSRLSEVEIKIVDHGTTDPKTFHWLSYDCPFTVYWNGDRMPRDVWEWRDFENVVGGGYYAVTDPDLDFSGCTYDLIPRCIEALEQFPHLTKVGTGLRLSDLPTNALTQRVIQWEGQFWNREIAPGLYEAPIDTTFAVYRPLKGQREFSLGPGGRWGVDGQVRHLPWYETTLNDELRYYRDHSRSGASHWPPEE